MWEDNFVRLEHPSKQEICYFKEDLRLNRKTMYWVIPSNVNVFITSEVEQVKGSYILSLHSTRAGCSAVKTNKKKSFKLFINIYKLLKRRNKCFYFSLVTYTLAHQSSNQWKMKWNCVWYIQTYFFNIVLFI